MTRQQSPPQERWKIIRTYDWNDAFQKSKNYTLGFNPKDKNPMSESAAPIELHKRLDEFINRPEVSQELTSAGRLQTGFNSEVEDWLKNIGYMR